MAALRSEVRAASAVLKNQASGALSKMFNRLKLTSFNHDTNPHFGLSVTPEDFQKIGQLSLRCRQS
jgi:hypothetical protein